LADWPLWRGWLRPSDRVRNMVDAHHPSLLAGLALAAGAPSSSAAYSAPSHDEVVPCMQCKKRKKCRAGHKCKNYARCGRYLEHGHIYGGDGTVGSGVYCSSSECKGLAGVPINGAIAKRRLQGEFAKAVVVEDEPAEEAATPLKEAASLQADDYECGEEFFDSVDSFRIAKVLAIRVCKYATMARDELMAMTADTHADTAALPHDFLCHVELHVADEQVRKELRWLSVERVEGSSAGKYRRENMRRIALFTLDIGRAEWF
jgi:hypothetical protein